MSTTYVPTQPKSPEAHVAALSQWSDLMTRPLGTGRGEFFGMPQNYSIPPARIYVVNHSRTRPWKKLMVPISHIRGAEDAIQYDKELGKIYSIETLYKQVEKGRDMNRYKKAVQPVALKLRVPGQPNGNCGCERSTDVIIPPAIDDQTKPVAVEVPEGTWDLYLGNYDRMRDADPTISGDEASRLAIYWSRRHNPVFAYTDDGQTTDLNNEYGFLEFVRIPVRAVLEPVDRAYLTSLDIVEAM